MDTKQRDKAIKNLQKELEKLKNKDFKIFFLVYDTEGRASGSLSYIYETAYTLFEKGYKVEMLYIEKDFIGVGGWLDEKFVNLPHRMIKDTLSVSPSDFLVMPEIHIGVIAQTKDLPCKRIILIENSRYLFDRMALVATMDNLRIHDCITTTENNKQRIKEWFPELHINVVRPCISEEFMPSDKEQKLIINIVSKSPSDTNSIVKPFYWKYPQYKWVTFRELRGLPRSEFAKGLKEGCITVWMDDKTDFGYAAIESMACKNIVIGKVPENEPDWLLDKEGVVRDNGLWFYKNDSAVDMIANAVETVITGNIPETIYHEGLITASEYTKEKQVKDIENVYVKKLIEGRKDELNLALKALSESKEKEED